MWDLKSKAKKQKTKLMATENSLVVVRSKGWGEGEMGEGGQKG